MTQTNSSRDLRIAIIGAGPGGMAMAMKLRQAGFNRIRIFEKAGGVGGTWYHNRYPGCACDIPSALYSYSFDIKNDWSRPYASQPEILEYFEQFAEKNDLLPLCTFNCEVTGARWDDAQANWTLALGNGESHVADVVVSALGMFNDLNWPDIPGLGDFKGKVFHSARWDWDYDLKGKTVGVIGSAASAVQFVPQIVKEAGQVYLYQRTANWVLPKMDDPYTDQQLAEFASDPSIPLAIREMIFEGVNAGSTFEDPKAVAEFEAQGIAAIEEVKDPEVRKKLTPDHPFGCKRPLQASDFYAAFNRDNLELVTEGIECITENAIVTNDGKSREVDTLIIATGFAATKYLSAIDVSGRNGLHIEEAWKDGANAYLGITTAGFPNLFMLYGPNTNNGNLLTMIEYEIDYAVKKIEKLRDESLAWIDVKPDVQEQYNEKIQKAIADVVVWQAGCNDYYRTESGRVVTQWPLRMTEFGEMTAKPDDDAYEAAPLAG